MELTDRAGAGARVFETRLILGSESPRRAALLRQIGARFEALAARTDETLCGVALPADYVMELAKRKASAVSATIEKDGGAAERYGRVIIIGADTVVVSRNGEIFGKPDGPVGAKRMLCSLSGDWHEVYTGVALADMRRDSGFWRPAFTTGHEVTRVRFWRLSDALIDAYAASGEPDGKAGAYAIQGAGALFVERIEGCYSNVVGLPLNLLRTMLDEIGYDLLMTNCLGK